MKFRSAAALFMAFVMLLALVPAAVSEGTAPRLVILDILLIDKGESFVITAAFEPETCAEEILWSSSDEKIAAVSKNGEVRALKAGQCVVTAETESGLSARCAVTVTRPVKSVALNKKTAELGLNRTLQLTATIKPKKADNQEIEWSSSDESVAVVDENGLVAAVGKGRAVITARAHNGKKAKCTVTVKNIKPTGIKTGDMFITVNPGDTYQLETSIKPKKASNTDIIFASSDENVAVIDENGLITAVSAGRAVITMTAAGKKSVKETVALCVVEKGAGRMAGLVIGLNPGHQTKTITKLYPIAPGSREKAYGCKVGAAGDFTRVPEYETNLQISLMLRDLLEAEGATVVMTRTENDVSIHNIKRAKMLNRANVDVALQIHCNSWINHSKHGLSVYRKTTGSWQREELAVAKSLTGAMAEATGALNLGVKINDRYMSLNWSTTPAVLLEVGYLSNRREDKLLATDAYRLKVAQGIAEGLAEYFGR